MESGHHAGFISEQWIVIRMKWKIADPRKRFNLISALILLIGLGSAAVIYQTAAQDATRASGYEVIDGRIYPIMPEDSKIYQHDLELYGGKANVLADEFRRWFTGLWHGKSLSFTVAIITIFLSFVVFYVKGGRTL
jgi:hypothetical protein